MPKHGEELKGEIICTRCKKTFTWLYQYKEPKNQSVFTVLDKAKEGESILKYEQDKDSFTAYCPRKGNRQEECGQPHSVELPI